MRPIDGEAHMAVHRPHDIDDEVLGAVLGLAADLELPVVLQNFVETCARLTDSPYAAINSFAPTGSSMLFVQVGVDERTAENLPHPPGNHGVLRNIPDRGTLVLFDLMKDPAFEGFPPGHPPMHQFLGTTIRVRDKVFGHLYLAEKPGGFNRRDAYIVEALAAAAGVAIQNAQLYELAARRERWLRAGQELTTLLLSGEKDEEEILQEIVSTSRYIADADTAALILPGVGRRLFIEFAEGWSDEDILGVEVPPDGVAGTALASGWGVLLDLATAPGIRVPEMRRFGPALYAPMGTPDDPVGVLVLLRKPGREPFDETDLATAETFAGQAAIAMILAAARQSQAAAELAGERDRIARDLHDLAIQQLFATGMQLETVRRRAARGVDATELVSIVEEALDNVDSTVKQIRAIVHALRDPDAATGLVERLRREASLARTGLSFAPSLVITIDGHVLGSESRGEQSLADDETVVDDFVADGLADDVVAVVREGLANAARHAHASSVQVTVAISSVSADMLPGIAGGGEVLVEVRDDGVGLDQVSGRRSGTGNLASRARQHGGDFTLTPNPEGQGTLVRWSVPLT
ncbi:GAF domain-containing sensor histidine kinase [Sanguibacter sp. A247]|uniref:GAF domain-containing sensor histidine kinase n=1 Tax=unclassified Sanguibacter TaxID=2645534 RepID=UPI003FD86E20